VLHKFGGVYIDTDLLLLKPFSDAVLTGAALGVETFADTQEGSKTRGGLRINNAFLAFPAGHPYVAWVMARVAASYDAKEWAAIGPDLITAAYTAQPDDVRAGITLLDPAALYPMHWARAHALLRDDRGMVDAEWPREKRRESTGVHLYNSNSYRHECDGDTCSYYRLMVAPPGSLVKELVDRVRVPQCDALRGGAREARERAAAKAARAAAAAAAAAAPAPAPAPAQ